MVCAGRIFIPNKKQNSGGFLFIYALLNNISKQPDAGIILRVPIIAILGADYGGELA
jgi:hypothetical protein